MENSFRIHERLIFLEMRLEANNKFETKSKREKRSKTVERIHVPTQQQQQQKYLHIERNARDLHPKCYPFT